MPLMKILNEELDWSEIALNPDVRLAFLGEPKKTLVKPGGMLSRFITTESSKKDVRGTHIFFSPWWTDWSTTASMLARWKTLKAGPKDVIRARLAVTKEFSQELDSLVQIVLTKPAYAWKGIARYQDDDDRGVTYLGGGEQFYLPNLASDSQGLSSNVAHLHCFTSVESIE